MKALQFISDNWIAISLVVSEVLALTPTKYNGIIQSIIKVVGVILKK